MLLTVSQLKAATGCDSTHAYAFIDEINSTLLSYQIDTAVRMAHFLSQMAIESDRLSRLEEYLSFTAEDLCQRWPLLFSTQVDAAPFARNPEALAERIYGGHSGNTFPGDAWHFRGRGLKLFKGRASYEALKKGMGVDVVTHPDWLAQPPMACLSAGWFWNSNGCNALADDGDVRGLTLLVDGGLASLAAREEATHRALAVLA